MVYVMLILLNSVCVEHTRRYQKESGTYRVKEREREMNIETDPASNLLLQSKEK